MEGGRRAWAAGGVLALAAAVVAGAWSWVPSAWSDEAATVSAATRPLAQLPGLVSHIDLVHAAYYVAMHAWFAGVGVHDWSLRLPSVVAVAVTALGTVVLGTRLVSLRLGVLAGILVCLVPQALWAATEARSFAWTMAVAVWLALAFVAAADGDSVVRWVFFGVLAALTVVFFVFAALLVVALAVSVATVPGWRRRWRPFAVAAGCAAVVTAPFTVVAAGQRSQVAWLSLPTMGELPNVLGGQWFGGGVEFTRSGLVKLALTAVFWLLAAAAVVHAALHGRPADGRTGPVPLVGLALPWLVVPTVALLAASLVEPVYTARYVTDSVPAIALLVAASLDRLRIGWRLAVLAAIAGLVVPAYAAQRAADAKGTQWSHVAAVIGTSAQPHDAFYVIDRGVDVAKGRIGVRSVLDVYHDSVGTVDDVAMGRSAGEAGTFEDELVPAGELAGRLEGYDRLWLVTAPGGLAWADTDDGAALTALGFTEAWRDAGARNDVLLLTR